MAALLTGCASGSMPAAPSPALDARPSVVVSFFPLADVAARIGGDAVRVVNLTPPGTGPHDLELTPQQRQEIESAEGVIYLGLGFQPQVERVVAGLGQGVIKVDLLTKVELLPVTPPLAGVQGEVDGEELNGGKDPHAWVGPKSYEKMVAALTATLVEIAPGSRAAIEAAATDYRAQLAALDNDFSTRLKGCRSNVIVTSHRAFEYLARQYGLTQIPIAGLSPDEEPDPRTLQAVAAAAKANNVTTVYFEDNLPPNLAKTVADEIGAKVDLLTPLETITQDDVDKGASYLSLQRQNLDSLVTGLRCTG